MSTIIDKLTAEGSGEEAGQWTQRTTSGAVLILPLSLGWLNELVANMWPNITVYASDMIKTTVEPMFKTMLPGPLASLHFTKLDLGPVPFKFSNVKVTKTETAGIKLDMNVDWAGEQFPCSIAIIPLFLSCSSASSCPSLMSIRQMRH